MIYLASAFIGYKIFSLSTLNSVGYINGVLIDPNRFSAAGFWVYQGKKTSDHPILLSQSIRQIDEEKILINDIADLNNPKDLPKLKEIFKIDYQIPGKKIISTNQENLGIAEDFSFNEDNFQIVHIAAKPPFYQRLKATRQHFTRSQIEKINNKFIEVNIDIQAEKLKSVPTNLIS